MKKNFIKLCMATLPVFFASCAGNSNPVIEGYDFSCDGILGKIPMGLAIQHGTALEINQEFTKEITEAMGDNNTEESYKKMEEAENKANEKLRHCTDDIQDDLAADSARLRSMKDINWENKTSCNVKLKEVRFKEEDLVSVKKNIVFVFDAPQKEVGALPGGQIYAVILDKKDSLVKNFNALQYFRTKSQYANNETNHNERALIINTDNIAGHNNIVACKKEEDFKKAAEYCLQLDSLYKIVLLDGDQFLDYHPKTMSLTGVGPVQMGTDMSKLPERHKDLYASCTEIPTPDADTYYSFDGYSGNTYFTGIGDSDGKLKRIEVESEYYPIKFGGVVLRVGDTYAKVVEKYGKNISWSYNPDNMSVRASFEGGKVYFEIMDTAFSASGASKVQQLENGAKNINITGSDLNPSEKLNRYVIQSL